MTVLCAICAEREPAPVVCQRCEDRIRDHHDQVGRYRRDLDQWTRIDRGTPGKDETGLLALVDNPLVKANGQPDLTLIAVTDPRSRRIIAGWHDTECGDTGCADPGCADPAHRQDPADDVLNVDHELITEARLVVEQRHLATPIASVFDAIRILTISRDWLTRCDRADEHADIMAGCAAKLRIALRDQADRVIGPCPAAHPDRDRCGGPLRFAWLGPLPLSPEDHCTPTHIRCDWCRDPWVLNAANLLGLLRITQTRAIPVPRAWAADVCQVRLKTLHEWVRRGHIGTYPGGHVNLVDVVARIERHADTSEDAGAWA